MNVSTKKDVIETIKRTIEEKKYNIIVSRIENGGIITDTYHCGIDTDDVIMNILKNEAMLKIIEDRVLNGTGMEKPKGMLDFFK